MMFCMKIAPVFMLVKAHKNDSGDAKIWLEPQIEIGRTGRSLSRSDLDRAIKIIERNLDRLQEAWNVHKRKAG